MEQQKAQQPMSFQPSYHHRQQVRFSDEEDEVIPQGTSQATNVSFEEFWYTRKQLLAFRSDVRQACAYIFHVLDVESQRNHEDNTTTADNSNNDSTIRNDDNLGGSGPIVIVDDDNDDNNTPASPNDRNDDENEMETDADSAGMCRTGLELYLDPGRCVVRTEMLQKLVEYSERLLDLQELHRLEGHAPCPEHVWLLLARMAVRTSKSSRLRAFEDGHANYCEVYPDRAMESPRQWEAYRRVLQRREVRQEHVLHKQQEQRRRRRRRRMAAQEPQSSKSQTDGGTGISPFSMIPVEDDDDNNNSKVQQHKDKRQRSTTVMYSCLGGDEDSLLASKRVCVR